MNHIETNAQDLISPSSVVWNEFRRVSISRPKSIKFKKWVHFSDLMGGLRMNEFTILCGATGTGKTSFLANISAELIINQVKHMVASVETGPLDYIRRVAEIFINKEINEDELNEEKLNEIHKNVDMLANSETMFLSRSENRINLNTLKEKITFASKIGCEVVMLDNLNFFLEVTSAQNSLIEMDRVIHDLIMLVKETPIHLILVAHPKKTDNGRVESEFDIKGSSTAVQEAQNVWLFNRMLKTYPDYNPYYRELTLAKIRRNGKYTGSKIIFDGSRPKYIERGRLENDYTQHLQNKRSK